MGSVSAAIFDDDRLLILRHSEGNTWVLPGGAIEPNEIPADALIREVEEEPGLLVTPERLIGAYGGPLFELTYKNGDRVTYVMLVFRCRTTGGSLTADGLEALEVRYVTKDELGLLQHPDWMDVVLGDVFASKMDAGFQRPTG
jgi:8-oxo-dGTP pyrophosphatase MutT (NUDIX family)